MTTTPTVWLEEFLSNLITTDAQTNPKVISLANGNFLVTWVDDNDTAADGFGTDIVGVIFDPLGNPISDSLYLNFPFGFSRAEDQVDIAATPDGGFVAVYRFPSGTDTDILFGRYDDEGNRTAQNFVVSDSSDAVVYTNPSIAVADDGSFFVTYEYTNGAVNDIRGVKVSAADVVGTEQILRADGFSNGSNLEDTEDPHTVLLTNGNFATVYSENDNNGGSNERTIEVRISNANGTNFSLINNVTAPDAVPDSDPRIAALPDGRFVVMWREGGNHNGRIFNNDGTESVAQFTISNNASLNFDGAEIIGLEDSSFVVALIDETQGRLFMIRYNDNVVDGGSRIVSIDASGTGGNITNLSMDLTGDGRILLSWENGEIYTEILDPRDGGSFNAEVDDGATTDRQGQSTTITGTADNDTIYGLDGSDTLIGDTGNDILIGGADGDMLDGGDDIDTVSYIGSSSGVTVDLENNSASGGDAEGDTIANFENVIGSDQNDILTGSDISNELAGGAGDDTLIGGAGGDMLDGGDDIDTVSYAGSSAGVSVRLQGFGALAGTQYAFGGDANGDTLTGFENVTGSSQNDDLLGSSGNNTLDGGEGADTLNGYFGNDILIGGIGGDTLIGGAGIDTVSYAGSSSGVSVRLQGFGALAGTQYAFGGDANGDTLTGFENVTGSSQNDDLLGSSGNNTLDGSAGEDTLNGYFGNDILIGGAGNDLLIGGVGADQMDGGADIDTVSYAGSSAGVSVRLQGFGALAGTQYAFGGDAAGDTLTGFENVTGSSQNDDLLGSSGNNTLDGGAGDDTLNGYFGNDILIGGAGNDILIGGAGADQMDGGADIDTVSYAGSSAGVSVRLQGFGALAGTQYAFGGDAAGDTLTGFENVTGSSQNDDLIGSAGANTLNGGAGEDTLNGYFDNDILIGGAGNDLLIGGTGDDLFVFAGASGSDTITDFVAGVGGEDEIDLQDSVFADYADVLANTNDDGSGNTVIAKSGVSITLNGVTKSQLDASDFILGAGMSAPAASGTTEPNAQVNGAAFESGIGYINPEDMFLIADVHIEMAFDTGDQWIL